MENEWQRCRAAADASQCLFNIKTSVLLLNLWIVYQSPGELQMVEGGSENSA